MHAQKRSKIRSESRDLVIQDERQPLIFLPPTENTLRRVDRVAVLSCLDVPITAVSPPYVHHETTDRGRNQRFVPKAF